MLKLYLYDITHLEDPREHPEWKNFFSEEKWEKTIRYLNSRERRQGVGAGFLLRYVMEQHDVKDWERGIYYGEHGKPLHDAICFNLSHSEDCVICVVSDDEVGCDIQKIRSVDTRLTKKCYSEEEQKYVFGPEEETRREENYTAIWTLKESYLKKKGIGLSQQLSQVIFHLQEPITVTDRGKKMSERFLLMDYIDYKIALCGRENDPEIIFYDNRYL